MHAVTNRRRIFWLATMVVIGTIGCRGSRPFGSMVRVTQENETDLSDLDAPKQRLATAKPRNSTASTTRATPSSTDLSSSAPEQMPTSERREGSLLKRGLSGVQAESPVASTSPSPQQTVATRQPESAARDKTALPEREIAEIKLPSGDAEELMVAFKDYPPEVQREALRRLVAATARSAERSDQPESVTAELKDQLNDLPELPDASQGNPNAPPAKRIASTRPSSSSVVSAAISSTSNRSQLADSKQGNLAELETTELQTGVAQISDDANTNRPGDVQTAIISNQSDASSVAQVSIEKDIDGSPTVDTLDDRRAQANEKSSPLSDTQLSSDQLFGQLLQQLSFAPDGESEADRASRLIKLRHMMVLSGDPDSAVERIEGMSESEQEYLRHQLLGLWTMIDPQGHPVPSRRFSTAVSEIREAAKFAAAATDSLEVRSLAFCTEIESYGQVKPFKTNRFDAGQQVILYCEIENFTAEKIDDGFETHLQGSYDLFNENDEKVVSQLLPADQQVSANYLRDYFIAYQMHLPEQLAKGKYQLQLTMEDVNGKKYGQARIPLEIKK